MLTALVGCAALEHKEPSQPSKYRAKELANQWRSNQVPEEDVVVQNPKNADEKPQIFYLQPLPGGGFIPIYPSADNDSEVDTTRYPVYQPEEDNPPEYSADPLYPTDDDSEYYYPLYFDE